jgi:Tfp pilus assembly protein PilP
MEIGTYIGKNWGKVTQIQSDVVVVTEEYEAMGRTADREPDPPEVADHEAEGGE